MQFYERALGQYNQLNKDPKKKGYFDTIATLALLIVLLVMIYPAVNHILKVRKEISEGKVFEQQLSDKIDALGQAETNLAAAKADLPIASVALPAGADFKKYLVKPIEDTANKSGLTLANVQFTDVPISDPDKGLEVKVRDMDFTLTLKGDFVKMKDFLTTLETFIRVTEINQLEIKRVDNTNEPDLTIQATTKYLGLPLASLQAQGGGD